MARGMSDDEVRLLAEAVGRQFGCEIKLQGGLYCLEGKRSLRVFYYTGSSIPDVSQHWFGLHLGDLHEGEFTPSVEGAGLVGASATRSVVEISREQAERVFRGEAVPHEPVEGVVLLKAGGRVVCAGRCGKEGLSGVIPDSRKTTA